MQDRNVILSNTQEFSPVNYASEGSARAKVEARFTGIIVVPGHLISKIELEEFDRSGIV